MTTIQIAVSVACVTCVALFAHQSYAGDYFVSLNSQGNVEKFAANGTDLGPVNSTKLVGPYGLAVDSSGNLFVTTDGVLLKNMIRQERI